MSTLRVIVATTMLLVTSECLAGWISGGTGELRGDSGNPWFLDIPEQEGALTYCVDADEAAMGLSRANLIAAVSDSLNFWQRQMPGAHVPTGPGDSKVVVKTGPFVFRDQPCDDSFDLAFQLGKISTPKQIKFIADQKVDLNHYVGFAARLSYDKNLKGTGFIYIAPENGSLRPVGDQLLDKFWTSDGNMMYRLSAVITHEIGHVFGIAHFGDAGQLMGQDFPEKIVTSNFTASHILWKIRDMFRAGDKTYFEHCFKGAMPTDLSLVLGLAPTDTCIRIRLTGDGLFIYATDDIDLPMKLVAQMFFKDSTWRERYHEVTRLWLPQDRNVFRDVPTYEKALSGPSVVETMVAGQLVTMNQPKARPALLIVDSLNFQLGVEVNGQFNPDILNGVKSGWQSPQAK